MTIQSYEIRALDDFGGRIHWMPSDIGAWCPADSVRRLETDMEALRAELAALKAPPKVLSAEEVTEPGWYKMRYPSGYSEFVRAISGGGCSCRIITIEGQFHNLSDCRFIGPVSPSES